MAPHRQCVAMSWEKQRLFPIVFTRYGGFNLSKGMQTTPTPSRLNVGVGFPPQM